MSQTYSAVAESSTLAAVMTSKPFRVSTALVAGAVVGACEQLDE